MKSNKLLLGLLVIATALGALFVNQTPTTKIQVSNTEVLPFNNRLNNATVMVSNKEKSSGGSGVIYMSTNQGSYILTNSHVCGVLEATGGLVSTNKGDYVVERYVRSKIHDICAIEILKNLGVNTSIAENVSYGDKIHISGHPFLLPNTITDGYLSNSLEITLLIDVKECTDKEQEENTLMCLTFGGMPIIKNYTAQATSSMIAPGNSGSGVYNDKGEIVGLAFAGIGRGISHGLIVPLEYLRLFLSKEVRTLQWVESNAAKRGSEFMKSQQESVTTNIPSNKELGQISFPAIKSEKFETAFDGLDSWNKTQKRLGK